MLSDNKTACWLALLIAPSIGTKTFLDLIQHASPQEIIQGEYKKFKLSDSARAALKKPDWQCIEKQLIWSEHPKNHILLLDESRYPCQLKSIFDPPPLLFVHGSIEALSFPQLAVVGSRKASHYGQENAFSFAKQIASQGLIITSGLALGIDACAHRGALAGNGISIAVVGTGLDRVYPAKHHDLAHQIAEQGSLVSELLLSTPPYANNFPRRNRILCGLTLATLVIEAAQKSGSLITARLTNEQGKEVFSIPGSIHNPTSKGCHQIIKEGALLTESPQEIIENIAPQIQMPNPIEKSKTDTILSNDEKKLLSFFESEPLSIDELIEISGFPADKISEKLLSLELDGLLTCQNGGYYSRVMI